MSTWKVILATLIIFVAGLVTGALVVRKTAGKPVLPPPNVFRSAMLKRLTDDLELSRPQRDQVNEILHESNERIKLLWEFVGPYFQDEYTDVRAELNAVFTPDQRKKFEQMLKKQRQRRAEDKQGSESLRPFPGGGDRQTGRPKGSGTNRLPRAMDTPRSGAGPDAGKPPPRPDRPRPEVPTTAP